MTMAQRYDFFAPIWRVMRDDNMTSQEVQRQVEHVALSVKRGSEVTCLGGRRWWVRVQIKTRLIWSKNLLEHSLWELWVYTKFCLLHTDLLTVGPSIASQVSDMRRHTFKGMFDSKIKLYRWSWR